MLADFAHELDMLLGALMAFAVREVLNQYLIGFEESFQDGSIKQFHDLIRASWVPESQSLHDEVDLKNILQDQFVHLIAFHIFHKFLQLFVFQ